MKTISLKKELRLTCKVTLNENYLVYWQGVHMYVNSKGELLSLDPSDGEYLKDLPSEEVFFIEENLPIKEDVFNLLDNTEAETIYSSYWKDGAYYNETKTIYKSGREKTTIEPTTEEPLKLPDWILKEGIKGHYQGFAYSRKSIGQKDWYVFNKSKDQFYLGMFGDKSSFGKGCYYEHHRFLISIEFYPKVKKLVDRFSKSV